MKLKPYYQEEFVTVYHGDSRDVVPRLNATFDCLLTDPPYGILNKLGTHKNEKGSRKLNFEWDVDGITEVVIEVIKASFNRLSSTGSCFIFCGADQISHLSEILRSFDMMPHPFVRLRQCPPPAGKGMRWPSGFELAIYGFRSNAYFGDKRRKRCNIITADGYRHGMPGKTFHPTQKDIGLMRFLVKSLVPPDGLCLDPFGGSGSTGVACQQLKRCCVLIEKEEKYCRLIRDRLKHRSPLHEYSDKKTGFGIVTT